LNRPVAAGAQAGWYHVTNRSANGELLFPSPEDAAAFLAVLGDVARDHPVEIHAYCAMGSHYHLLVRAAEAEMLRALSRLEAGLAAKADEPRLRRLAFGRHLLQVTRYIHRNPLEAGLVRRAEDWPWSSYRGYLDRLEGPAWLRSDAVLGWLGSLGPRQRYRRFVES
jgi:REP element-mobilizing transposase RayT